MTNGWGWKLMGCCGDWWGSGLTGRFWPVEKKGTSWTGPDRNQGQRSWILSGTDAMISLRQIRKNLRRAGFQVGRSQWPPKCTARGAIISRYHYLVKCLHRHWFRACFRLANPPIRDCLDDVQLLRTKRRIDSTLACLFANQFFIVEIQCSNRTTKYDVL